MRVQLFKSACLALLLSPLAMTAFSSTAEAHCGTCDAGDEKDANHGEKHAHTIVETAANAGTFSVLLKAAEAAGMVDALNQPGPLTVFAPTDAAFAKLPAGTIEALLKDPEKLKAILSYHVVAGSVDSKAAAKAGSASSLLGPTLTFKKGSDGLMVQNAAIEAADLGASNGMIHVIDAVLLPPDA